MKPILHPSTCVIAIAAFLALGGCADRSPPSTGKVTVAVAATFSPLFAADVEDNDQGYAIQAARIGMPFITGADVDDVEAASVIAIGVPSACAAALASIRFEDPSDACWAAFSSAMVRGDLAQATVAIRTGCEKYRRADYCERLPELGEIAGLETSEKGERL